MHEYELCLVVNARISDDERAAVVEKAKGYITRFGGEVGEVEEWGKRKLAYEIQKMGEAYYYFVPFTAGPECPNDLEKEMRIMENVLRYLIVRQDGEDEFHLNVAQEEAAEEEEAEEAVSAEEAEEAEEAAEDEAEEAPAEDAEAEETEA